MSACSHADTVRALIAERVLAGIERMDGMDGAGERPSHLKTELLRVGGFTLRPNQVRTLAELRAALDEFGGALLADPPGTGKTVLALAAAADANAGSVAAERTTTARPAPVLVLAPSTLRAQWLSSADRARVPITFSSLESLSRAPSRASSDFVIIDEAHHVRTTTTQRYAHISAACVGARVLLLSATPVVNRAADRDALLALFLGSRAETLTPAELGRCIVRRRAQCSVRPTLTRLGAIDALAAVDAVDAHAESPGIADALRHLPPPLPLTDGASATALIAMNLAMAWQSSLAALDMALRRRSQRGAALADLLRVGRAPSRAALRYWTVHDDATQLALPLLVTDAATSIPSDTMLPILERHLAAVRALREQIRPHRAADAIRRASALRALLSAHPDRRVVVFARHAETVRALHTALRDAPGVVAIVGTRVRAASGRWSRDEVLRAVGPRSRALDPHDARAIRLILTTDALAEGVEMQGVGIVVHADLPWTPARLEQRVGRVVRVGSGAREVLETWFTAPRGARALVRLGARLRRKARLRRGAVRDGDARGALIEILERWRDPADPRPRDRSASVVRATSPAMDATVDAGIEGFITVVDDRGTTRLMCGIRQGGRWRVTSSPRGVLALLKRADRPASHAATDLATSSDTAHSTATEPNTDSATVRSLRRLIVRILERRAARSLTGSGPSPHRAADAPSSQGNLRLRRIRTRLARLLERAPALARLALAERHEALLHVLASPLEAAREAKLDALLRADLDDSTFARQLGALLRDRLAGVVTDARARYPRATASTAPHPLLLLRPAAVPRPATRSDAPPSVSPGTAAPR